MPAKWQQWYPHKIDQWSGSGSIIALSDAAYRVVHYLTMAAWQSEDGFLPSDEKQLAKLGLAVKQGDYSLWEKAREEVFEYFEKAPDGRLFHPVIMREREEAKRLYGEGQARREVISQKRKEAGERGNIARWSQGDRNAIANESQPYPKTSPTVTVTKTETVTKTNQEQPPSGDASLNSRMLCESVGCFDMREQSAVTQVMDSYSRHSKKSLEESRDYLIAQWGKYGSMSPRLAWVYGSAYKFFMSGKWDNPDAWPWKPGESPPRAGKKNADRERTQAQMREMDDARKEWERCREEDAIREAGGAPSG